MQSFLKNKQRKPSTEPIQSKYSAPKKIPGWGYVFYKTRIEEKGKTDITNSQIVFPCLDLIPRQKND